MKPSRSTTSVLSTGALLWAISLVVAPLLYVAAISFLQRGTYGGLTSVLTLENYRKLIDPAVWPLLSAAFGRSFVLASLSTLACVLLAFPVVLFLVFVPTRWRHVLLFLLIIPFWTNFLLRTYAWFVLLSDEGWLNSVLQAVFGEGVALHWLFTPWAVFLGMLYNYLPYMILCLYVSLERLERILLDAAADLGATRVKRFLRVTLPLCVPGLTAGCFMVFIPSFGEFVIPDILGGGTKMYLGGYLAQQFLSARNWPFGGAICVVLVVSFLGLLFIAKRFRVKVV